MSELDGLVGKKIYDISVSNGEEYLVFHTDEGEVWYVANGDCCSRTWFSGILGVKFLLNERVLYVEDMEMPAWYNIKDGRCRQEEEDRWYGHEITTKNGVATIVYRNSSNGYYGGWISLMDGRPNPEGSIGMRVLFDDWSA